MSNRGSSLSLIAALAICIATPMVNGQVGPDLAVSGIGAAGAGSWGSSGGIAAFSFSVTVCNSGDVDLPWVAVTPEHPVITANLYRVWDGRLEQIGMSWAHHTSCALDIGGACSPCFPTSGCSALGFGCETTSSSAILGSPTLFGPRSDVEARNGVFSYPPTIAPTASPIGGGRLLVAESDLDPVSFPAARYFVEVQAVSSADSVSGQWANNVSWREVTVVAGQLVPVGPTRVGEPALTAWQEVHGDVELTSFETFFDGRFYAAGRAVDLGASWRYEYAIFNLNSMLGAGSFSVPNASASYDHAFADVDYHSGDIFDGTDWALEFSSGIVRWTTESSLVDPLANALRWGTTYSFGFTDTTAPTAGEVFLTPFSPGMSPNPTFALPVPSGGSGVVFRRGDVNVDLEFDLSDAIAQLSGLFSPGSPPFACDDAADTNDDGLLDISDAIYSLAALFVVGAPGLPRPGIDCGVDLTADALRCGTGCP